jgi:curved DNA-binding protein CbpA
LLEPHTNMTGKLDKHPLTELIRETIAEKLSGSLRLEHDRIKTVLYLEGGNLLYATSNLRPHRLAEALRRWRVITDAQFAALPEAGRSDAETGRALLEQKVLTKDALDELRARLIADVLRPALLWTEGRWDFDARVRLTADVRAKVELPELLMEAARRLPATLAMKRFPDGNEKLLPVTEPANNLNLLPGEAFVLSRIDAPLRLHELLAISGLPQAETLHACYALALGGLIGREGWVRAFTPEEVAKALAAGAAAAAKSAATETARPSEARKSEEAAKPAETQYDEKRELEELFERVARATNHYQILGVGRSSDQETLKQTYHSLARRFHPDRFHQNDAIRSRLEEAFAKIAQAYETLRDKSSRAAYDLKIGKEAPTSTFTETKSQAASFQPTPSSSEPPSTSPTATPAERAEDNYQRGMGALKMGKTALAVNFFAEAARLEPRVGRYRAQYGQALASNLQMGHRAETEIQAAILLEPANVTYRIMLARLYRNLGFIKRALAEIERARSLAPQNAEALELLAELQSIQGAR